MMEYDRKNENIQKMIDNFDICTTSIKKNKYIKQVLSNILTIGNYLNAGDDKYE